MKKLFVILICIVLYACPVNHAYGPNYISESGLKGRVENLEDALKQMDLEIKNVTLDENLATNSKVPIYELKLALGDTIIDYQIELRDCQGFRELINGSDWNCDYSNINILSYRTNVEKLPFYAETDLFRKHVIPKIKKVLEKDSTTYSWRIQKNMDSIVIRTLDQNQKIRREQIYRYVQTDTTFIHSKNSTLALIKLRDYSNDSIREYLMDRDYHYLRISEINTMPNTVYN